jgi:hypothetical protein
VNYQDQDDNYPIRINVVINNTAFPMTKVDFYDNNYTDGCMYQYLTYLPSSIHNYSYYFECYDGKFTYNTIERDNVHVYESNSIGPSLTNGDVTPDTGYRKATIFTFMVSYTDPDNNAPAYINVQIDMDIFPMVKQDYLDSNFMDGCVYIYSTTFDDPSFHNFSFFCSDGIYSDTIGPYFGPSVEKSNLFTGMYMNYLFTLDEANSYDTNVSYNFKTGNIFTATWDLMIMTSTWDINMNDRIMTNVINPVWLPGTHTPFWVHTDITIGDILNITVDGIGDETFIVSNEFYIDYPAVGSVGVWELHGITTPESIAFYEQSTGILLNSTFFYNNYNYTLELIDTNAECNPSYLPGNFMLNTDAGTPDGDGMFNLSWSTSEYAVNYSIYMHSSFMSEIPPELTPVITETTDRITPITINTNGTYYFIVVAHNKFGNTLSNCLSVEVRIYRDTMAPLIYIIEPESGDEYTANIPIYEITVTELHLDSVWYSLDGGITNISITSYIGVIDEVAWNALPYEPVIITFYANDTAGNIGSSSVIVYKHPLITPEIPGPFVVLILIILFTGIIGLSWRQKRKLN